MKDMGFDYQDKMLKEEHLVIDMQWFMIRTAKPNGVLLEKIF